MTEKKNTSGESGDSKAEVKGGSSEDIKNISEEIVDGLHDRFNEMLMTDENYFADHDRIVNDLISFAHKEGQGRDCKVEDLTYGAGKHDIGTWEIKTSGGESVTGLEYLSSAVVYYKCFNEKGGIDNTARKEALRRLKLAAGESEDVVNKKNPQPKRYKEPKPDVVDRTPVAPESAPPAPEPASPTAPVALGPTVETGAMQPEESVVSTVPMAVQESRWPSFPSTVTPTPDNVATNTSPVSDTQKKSKSKSWSPSSSQKPQKREDHLRDLAWKHPSGTHGGNLMDRMAERRRTLHAAFQGIRNGNPDKPVAPEAKKEAPVVETPKKVDDTKVDAQKEAPKKVADEATAKQKDKK